MWEKGEKAKKKEKGKRREMKKFIKDSIELTIIDIKLGLIKLARFLISIMIKFLDKLKVDTE